jgi:Omp85 superfamily domain
MVFLLTMMILFNSVNAYAEADSTDAPENKILAGTRWAPFISSSPETSLILGAQATHFWRPILQPDSERPSSIALTGLVSLRGQWRVGANYDLYFNNFAWRLFGNVGFERFPLDFFGVGVHSLSSPSERYTPETWRGSVNAAYRLLRTQQGAGLSAGVRYEVRADRILSRIAQGILENENITGVNGGVMSGAGGFLVLDTRDNVFSSWSGAYIEAQSTIFTPLLGSSFAFVRHSVDARYFQPLSLFSMTHILALQGGVTVIDDTMTGNQNAPFYALPSLSPLRGILIGQFADRTVAFVQAEYRVPFLEVFEVVAFLGAGASSTSLETLPSSRVQAVAGGGVRFFFDPNERLGIRMDIGVPLGGPYGSSPRFYFTFGEAF